jgi:hypothetical protein
MALSELELRHIIERSFLPIQCKCSIDSRGDISIELLDRSTGSNMAARGIPRSRFESCREISSFVAQMRAQLSFGNGKAVAGSSARA